MLRKLNVTDRARTPASRAGTVLVAVAVCAGLAGGAALMASGLGAARRPGAAPLPSAWFAGGGPGGHGTDAPPPGKTGSAGKTAGASVPGGLRAAALAGRTARPAWQAGLEPGQIRIPALGVTAFIGAAVTNAAGETLQLRAQVEIWRDTVSP